MATSWKYCPGAVVSTAKSAVNGRPLSASPTNPAETDDGSGGGDYLRREGLYSSQITQWRQLRDGGALTGNLAGGTKTPKLTAEQLENARLKRQLEVTTRKLTTTAAVVEIMGKLQGLCAPRGARSYRRFSRWELEGRFLGLMAYPDAER